jgi:nitrite reductase/ring-hydroxylating ferredoxin subunit
MTDESDRDRPAEPERRRFLELSSKAAMATGLAAGYGTLGLVAGRNLYPARPDDRAWVFVTGVDRLAPGGALHYESPTGEAVTVARQGSAGGVEDFIALSSTCPHLGCQVHWEASNDRFFCPCHNGTFDAAGRGTGGPPGDAGQSLPRYALRVEDGLLFIEVPTASLARGEGRVVEARRSRPGHDPCLDGDRRT